jgi:hypothetical protein
VVVKLGYNEALVTEFTGYVQYVSTDSGDLTINCEDDLFLMRKPVKSNQFRKATIKEIAQYLIDQIGIPMDLNCTNTIVYDSFVIYNATAIDVLKKIKEETRRKHIYQV